MQLKKKFKKLILIKKKTILINLRNVNCIKSFFFFNFSQTDIGDQFIEQIFFLIIILIYIIYFYLKSLDNYILNFASSVALLWNSLDFLTIKRAIFYQRK